MRRRGTRGAVRPRRRGHARRQPRHARRVACGAAGQRTSPHPRQAHGPQGGGRGHIAGAALGVRDARRRTGQRPGRRGQGVAGRLLVGLTFRGDRRRRPRPRADPQGGRRRPGIAAAHDHGPPCSACRGLPARLLFQRRLLVARSHEAQRPALRPPRRGIEPRQLFCPPPGGELAAGPRRGPRRCPDRDRRRSLRRQSRRTPAGVLPRSRHPHEPESRPRPGRARRVGRSSSGHYRRAAPRRGRQGREGAR